MECIKCKAVIEDDSIYCRFCGKKQVAERKYKKRSNNSGCVYKQTDKNRANPWIARKNNVYIGAFKTRAEAQKALERITDVDVTDKYNLTFKDVYERWKADHSREIAEKTMKDYDWAFSICEPLHDRKIRSILRSDYQAIIIEQEQKGRSKGTCHKVKVVMGMIGRLAFEEGITQTNNADGLTTVAKQLKERETFLDADIKAIRASKLEAADIALVLLSCGCRPGELFKVPIADCYEDYFIGGSKTEAGKNRVIPIGNDGISAYQKIRKKALESGADKFIDGYTGSHVYANYAKREWKLLMDEIGRDGITPYVCRHTFITNAIRGGMDLPVLEAVVGHMDRETTRLYTHLHAEDLVGAVQGLKKDKISVVTTLPTQQKSIASNSRKKLAK